MQYSDELSHYGILGQKWGVRRYQNEDGTLTEAGKKRYADNYDKSLRDNDRIWYGDKGVERINKRMSKGSSHVEALTAERQRKLATRAATIVGIYAAMVYGPKVANAAVNAVDIEKVMSKVLNAADNYVANADSVKRGEAAVYATFREIETGLATR